MRLLKKKKILIIKFGGLGDFILSLSAIESIKKHHKKDDIILVTEKPYKEIALKSNYFKEIILIKRSYFYFLDKVLIKKELKNKKIDKVYDLQTSRRSSSYFSIFRGNRVEWSGIAKGSSFEHTNPLRDKMHTIERQKEQLLIANISMTKNKNYSWLFNGKYDFKIPKPYGVIVPGGAAKRKYKRIPIKIFESIIEVLEKKNIIPVLIGTSDELKVCRNIKKKFPNLINLCCNTSILELAFLLKESNLIIGNDTGPMHLGSLSGTKTLVFFTRFSNSKLCGPRGKDVQTLIYEGNQIEFLKKVKIFLNSF